jgi:hypothetical protein
VAHILLGHLESINRLFQWFWFAVAGPFQFTEFSIGLVQAPSEERSAKPLAFDLAIDAEVAFAV